MGGTGKCGNIGRESGEGMGCTSTTGIKKRTGRQDE
jgi:hypothetical protein